MYLPRRAFLAACGLVAALVAAARPAGAHHKPGHGHGPATTITTTTTLPPSGATYDSVYQAGY